MKKEFYYKADTSLGFGRSFDTAEECEKYEKLMKHIDDNIDFAVIPEQLDYQQKSDVQFYITEKLRRFLNPEQYPK